MTSFEKGSTTPKALNRRWLAMTVDRVHQVSHENHIGMLSATSTESLNRDSRCADLAPGRNEANVRRSTVLFFYRNRDLVVASVATWRGTHGSLDAQCLVGLRSETSLDVYA